MEASSTPDFCLVGGPASGVAGLDDGAGARGAVDTPLL